MPLISLEPKPRGWLREAPHSAVPTRNGEKSEQHRTPPEAVGNRAVDKPAGANPSEIEAHNELHMRRRVGNTATSSGKAGTTICKAQNATAVIADSSASDGAGLALIRRRIGDSRGAGAGCRRTRNYTGRASTRRRRAESASRGR